MKKDFFLTKIDYTILLIISIVVALIIIIRDLFLGRYDLFFWFCDFTPFLVLVALKLKSRTLLQGVANVGFFIQIFYLVSIIIAWVFGNGLFSHEFVESVFQQSSMLIFITILVHSFNIVLFLIIIKYKPLRGGVAHSLGVIALMYFPAILFFSRNENINMVYSYVPFSDYLPFYNTMWIFWMFLIIVIPTHFIAKFLHSKFYSQSP